jgi:hypothetical protein
LVILKLFLLVCMFLFLNTTECLICFSSVRFLSSVSLVA